MSKTLAPREMATQVSPEAQLQLCYCLPTPARSRGPVLPWACHLLESHHVPACRACLPCLPADDSNAFLAAVAAASMDAKANGQGVAVLVPAGRYKITKVLVINQSYVVLRGKGVSPPASPLLA